MNGSFLFRCFMKFNLQERFWVRSLNKSDAGSQKTKMHWNKMQPFFILSGVHVLFLHFSSKCRLWKRSKTHTFNAAETLQWVVLCSYTWSPVIVFTLSLTFCQISWTFFSVCIVLAICYVTLLFTISVKRFDVSVGGCGWAEFSFWLQVPMNLTVMVSVLLVIKSIRDIKTQYKSTRI